MAKYRELWCEPEGRDYRSATYQRQNSAGTLPLVDNPHIDSVIKALKFYQPDDVLEIGCGWGRWLEQLNRHFHITGCDASLDMLRVVPDAYKDCALHLDITAPLPQTGLFAIKTWDVAITRGVLHYLLDDLSLLNAAVRNMHTLVRSKVILWELPEVCEVVEKYNSSLFDLRPIERKEE